MFTKFRCSVSAGAQAPEGPEATLIEAAGPVALQAWGTDEEAKRENQNFYMIHMYHSW